MKENEIKVVGTIKEGDNLRTVLEDGSSAQLPFSSFPVATSNQSGLMSSLEYNRKSSFIIPGIDTRAIPVAIFNVKANGYYNASITVRLDSFQQSVFGIISISKTNKEIAFALKFIGITSKYSNIYIVEENGVYKLYLSGSYNSGYTTSVSEAMSNSDKVTLINNGEAVLVNTLSPSFTFAIKEYTL